MLKYVALVVILALGVVAGGTIGTLVGNYAYLDCVEKYSYFQEMPKLYYPIVQIMCDDQLSAQYQWAGFFWGPLIGAVSWYSVMRILA